MHLTKQPVVRKHEQKIVVISQKDYGKFETLLDYNVTSVEVHTGRVHGECDTHHTCTNHIARVILAEDLKLGIASAGIGSQTLAKYRKFQQSPSVTSTHKMHTLSDEAATATAAYTAHNIRVTSQSRVRACVRACRQQTNRDVTTFFVLVLSAGVGRGKVEIVVNLRLQRSVHSSIDNNVSAFHALTSS